MVDIIHRIGIAGSVNDVYKALTTDKGLSTWWTTDTVGAGKVGSIIAFRFEGGGPDFEVAELKKDSLVRWKHSGEMPEPWMGTEISFQHSNWKTTSEFMAHCSTKWALFLMSLKDAIETGKGRPFPDDVHIDHDE